MKSVLVIGMGRFGQHLANEMLARGNEVMIVDVDPQRIEELAHRFTDAQIGDCTNTEVLRALGVSNFDVCFVAIGENFQASLEISSLLKELGAKQVVSKANKEIQAKFLLRNGADEVIYPERDVAIKTAIKYSANHVLDYVGLPGGLGMYEIRVPDAWIGKTIGAINIRHKFGVSILAIRHGNDMKINLGADYEFRPEDHMHVVGKEADVNRLTGKI